MYHGILTGISSSLALILSMGFGYKLLFFNIAMVVLMVLVVTICIRSNRINIAGRLFWAFLVMLALSDVVLNVWR